MTKNHFPRNDYVLLRRVVHGQTPSGIAVGDTTLEGIDHVVVSYGDKVKNLKEGDKVLIVGQHGLDYAFLPNDRELFVTKEQNVVLVYK